MTAKHVFTISPVQPFADTLAAELLKQNVSDPAELARTVLFLPTRRACRTVQEAFLRQSGGKPLMLPRLLPFSAVEKPETQASLGLPVAADPPDAIAPLRRRLLLAKLIQRRDQTLSAQKALDLADTLAAFLDEVYIEGMPFDRLKDIVPVELAAHWQETLTFLEIITDVWQDILAEEHVIDAADRQVRLFSALARHWRATPPDYPVIAAGSTGSRPATADLLDAIASMENGKIILPGLDTISDDESFAAVEPSHPQYNLKKLLERMGVPRRDVLPFGTPATERSERRRLICEAMRPAATTDAWRTASKFGQDALTGVRKIDCADEREEALVIAMILRQTLETPEKTAALITPDRFLARRVVAEMKRWGIEMDDSAGTNLTLTPTGTFLLLLGQAAQSNAAPADLLACLKHPTALGGQSFAPFRSTVRELERRLLRGKRPGSGLSGLLDAAAQNVGDRNLVPFVSDLIERIGDFIDMMTGRDPLPFGEMLDAHLTAAERLAQSADKSGAERLWSGDAGEAAADFLTQIKEQADLIGDIAPAEYLPLIYALFKGVTVRPKYGTHPRLDILGTMEARLIQPDVMILGGLNEGVWPQTPETDPWLSRPMREKCGLPSPERKIALSAHDFAQAFCARNLIMTRAVKSGGTPGVPSRWLSRLQTVLGISGLTFDGGDELSWAREIDKPAVSLSFLPPKPTPPVSARPRRLSVTKIETLMRDPYGIYARHILGLQKIKDIDEPFSAADFGAIAHKIIEVFCKRHADGVIPDDAENEILAVADEQIAAPDCAQTDATFWKPRLQSVLIWFVDQMRECGDIKKVYSECDGALTFTTKGGSFALTGRADRIDLLKDGSARIVDYKTGAPPSEKRVVTGYAPQLPLEAAIYKYGAFDDVPPADVERLEYWRLIGRKKGGTVKRLKADAQELTDDALNRLKDLINAYDDESMPYYATPDTSLSLAYNDYEHLARFDEWATAAENEDDDEDDGEAEDEE